MVVCCRWGEARGRPRRVWRVRPEARSPKSPRRARRRRIPTNRKSEYTSVLFLSIILFSSVKKNIITAGSFVSVCFDTRELLLTLIAVLRPSEAVANYMFPLTTEISQLKTGQLSLSQQFPFWYCVALACKSSSVMVYACTVCFLVFHVRRMD